MSRLPVVGILGNPCGVLVAGESVDTLNEYVGENTGNLLFQHAMWKLIQNPKINFRLGVDFDVDYFRQNIDILCIPAANQINPMWDLEAWADLVEFLDKPVIVAGLGAQAKIGEVKDIRLSSGTRRFIQAVYRRSSFIGVRGEETKSFLESIGVDNAVITGCPSNFINNTLTGSIIKDNIESFSKKDNPRINYVFGTMEEISRDYEAELFNHWLGHEGKIIYQTNKNMMNLLINGVVSSECAAHLQWQNGILAPQLSISDYIELLRSRGVFFFDPLSWINSASAADLTIGLRIHGAVAAIQGRSLGVCVAFDSRTLELASTMGYPYLHAAQISELTSLSELEGILNFTPDEFDWKRNALRSNLKTVLQQHGLVDSLSS
jgi:hypothetical protein